MVDATITEKKEVIKRDFYLYTSQLDFLLTISKEKKTNPSIILREMLDQYKKIYLHKKGSFICQNCGKEKKNKEMHEVQVELEMFLFGDCCYFNNAYKTVIRKIL